MLVILGLVAALVFTGNERDKAKSKLKDAEKQIQQLQDQNKQLKTEKENETRKAEAVLVPPVRPEPVKRVFSSSGSCEPYRSIFAQYPWNIEIALAVCKAESGGNPNVVSATNDFGLMQLHNIPIYDPAANIAYAYNEKYLKPTKYMASGWGHWSVCNNGTVRCW